jgi:hypothetical protein
LAVNEVWGERVCFWLEAPIVAGLAELGAARAIGAEGTAGLGVAAEAASDAEES